MTTWAVIPAKSFAEGKSRLTHLSALARVRLARELFAHVIACVHAARDVAGVLVLTNGDDVAERARARGANVLFDISRPAHAGQSGHLGRVVDAGLAHLGRLGVGTAIVLMADLPELSPADVDDLIASARQRAMVVVPDRRELGTNALALSPPDRLSTCFGHVDSFTRHLDRARRSDLAVHVHRSVGLARDIDVPTDLATDWPAELAAFRPPGTT